MEINHDAIMLIIGIVQIIGVPLFIWIAKKSMQIQRAVKYQSLQVDTLVDATSKQFDNGDFRDHYDKILKEKMEKHNFIYKG